MLFIIDVLNAYICGDFQMNKKLLKKILEALVIDKLCPKCNKPLTFIDKVDIVDWECLSCEMAWSSDHKDIQ
jgi:ribosomal protein L37AE/L43A